MRRAFDASRAALALGLLLASCGSRSGGSGPSSLPAFVGSQIANNTSESAEPVDVGPASFAFTEDPHAFDSVLPVDAGPVVGP